VSFEREPVLSIERRAPHVVREVHRFCREVGTNLDTGRGIWFTGDVGTGKTTLAMIVSKAAVEADRTVAIYSLPRLLARIRRTYDADAREDSYLQFFERLTSVDLLHIDDLGAEKRSDWVLEQLYAIVDERYETQRSMVVTTNIVAEDELAEQIGQRTVSRLVEICGSQGTLLLGGADQRYRVA
jgi:DNA replication protein DnaC